MVACSNENKSNVYPQSADFTFYGGLYRGLNLISVPEVHFELMYWGSDTDTVRRRGVCAGILGGERGRELHGPVQHL